MAGKAGVSHGKAILIGRGAESHRRASRLATQAAPNSVLYTAAESLKAQPCYTVFALSDLAVSGGLPHEGNFAWHRFSPSPYSVTT